VKSLIFSSCFLDIYLVVLCFILFDNMAQPQIMIILFSLSPLLKNSFDLDDNTYGAVSFSPAEKETRSTTAVANKISSGSEAIALVSPSTSSVKTTGGPKVDEKLDASPISDPNYNPATVAVPSATTTFGSDKPALPNGSTANPLFNFAKKVISLPELTTSVASSKEISAPVFGLEKVVPSKEAGADAPSVNLDTNQNVFKVSPNLFTASSVGGESTLKFGASFDSNPGGSIRLVYVTVVYF
jgi:hypothetical protein